LTAHTGSAAGTAGTARAIAALTGAAGTITALTVATGTVAAAETTGTGTSLIKAALIAAGTAAA
jgi:hypothetical protein